jgi:regulator of cell morphogenesis and NO signaling
MKIHQNTTVGEVAAAMPGALPVLQRLKIDFCCGGKASLLGALGERGVSVDEFLQMVEAHEARRDGGAQDFSKMAPEDLTRHIEATHHEYLRHALPEVDELFLKVLKAHGVNHPELFEVYKLFGRLKAELNQHLIKEEALLFPALTRGDEAYALAAEIMAEHEGAGALLEAMRSVSSDYAVPADACMTYRRVYALLPELEADLHQHIHLENNILMKDLA